MGAPRGLSRDGIVSSRSGPVSVISHNGVYLVNSLSTASLPQLTIRLLFAAGCASRRLAGQTRCTHAKWRPPPSDDVVG
jgi:hypothetical protein